MYILLTGALKNVGDFLIADRCKKLIEYYNPGCKIVEISRYEPLDDKLDLVNSSKAVILAGGPGYLPKLYPNVFRLTRRLADIKVPIIPMGMGWFGQSKSDISIYNYKFTPKSMQLLNRMKEDAKYFGARDYHTARMIKNNGFNNALMTGCPAWYDVDYMDKDFDTEKEIKKVVFSTPAGAHYAEQTVKMMEVIKEKYPKAELICSFHRGIEKDQYTDENAANVLLFMKNAAENLGYKIADLSYDLSKMSIYDECDIHIGYRVHAHIYCLSHRVRSILLNEDGRGSGLCHAISLNGIDCYYDIVNQNNQLSIIPNQFAQQALADYIDELIEEKYERYNLVKQLLVNKFAVMNKFLQSIPQ